MSNRPPFKQAFTFDDVLLVPQKSSVLPRDVNLKTRLTNALKPFCLQCVQAHPHQDPRILIQIVKVLFSPCQKIQIKYCFSNFISKSKNLFIITI